MRNRLRGALVVAVATACPAWGMAQEGGEPLRRTESKQEKAMLTHANLYRSGLDLPLLTRDTELSVDCLRHALYMDRNNKTGHPEDANLPGYSARGHAAGMASIIAYTAPERSVDMWMDSFLHRIPIITPTGARAGVGWHAGTNVTGALLDTRRGGDSGRGRDAELHWPPDGMVGVPTSMSREQPNPTPYRSSDEAGYPVTCTFHPSTRVTESTGVLYCGGAKVAVFFSSPDKPTRHGRAMQQNTIALIPERNLSSGKVHRVELSATVNGKPWTATWTFTTGARGKGFDWIAKRAKDQTLRDRLAAKKQAQDEARTARDSKKALAVAKGMLRSVPDQVLAKAIHDARTTRALLPEPLREELDEALAKAETRVTAAVTSLVQKAERERIAKQYPAALKTLAEADRYAAGVTPWTAQVAKGRAAVKAAQRAAANADLAKKSGELGGSTLKNEAGWQPLLEGGKVNKAWTEPHAPISHWRTHSGAVWLDAKQMLVTLAYLNHTDDWTDYELKAQVQVTKGAQILTRASVKDGDFVGNYLDVEATPAGEWKTLHITVRGTKVTLTCGTQTIEQTCETKAGGFMFIVDDGQKLTVKDLKIKRAIKKK